MEQATDCVIGLAAAAGAKNVSLPMAHGDHVALGCLTYVLDDQSQAFTGDAHTIWHLITEQIFTLPEACLLYPGHDDSGRCVTSVAEEKLFNARLGGTATERDFVGHMETTKLPHPGKIAEALPTNLRSGQPAPLRAWRAGRPCNAATPDFRNSRPPGWRPTESASQCWMCAPPRRSQVPMAG
ncbi:MAG: hypothetical protein RLZZ117_1798 [Cyanobacteriota bacterium]|jgi:hypothetical protein